MKKTTLILAAMIAVGTAANAQCAKYVLMEQFTQASCGPCAGQNPGFKTAILDPNPQKVRHIAYHTSWPGVDPMYNANTVDNGGRTTFYNVTGVPHVKLLGLRKSGAPSGFTQSDVDFFWSEGSPIKITVSEVDNGSTRTVTATIKSIGAPPSGSFNILGAIVERNRTYGSPPGSNGETYFPNVFLDMLQTSTNGQAFTLPSQGNSVTWGPFTYNESLAQNPTELGVIVFIQNTNSTKEVIQTGSTFDQVIDAVMFQPAQLVKQGTTSSLSSFSFNTGNSGNASGQFNYTLTSVAPSGWTSGFSVNSTPYTTSATVTIPANTNYPTTIDVTPNANPGVGKFTLSMTSVANPSAPAMTMTVYVIANVTDLVVNNTSGLGTGSGTPAQFESQFTAGLVFAGNTANAATDVNVLIRAIMDGAMGNVKNIYMNMAWSFPTLTDALVAQLTTFLNTSGKCMFICGQDIGWETMDAASTYDTPNTQAFYTNFLNASYSADGGSTNTQLTSQVSDPIFGSSGNHSITNTIYTSTNFFPDELNAVGNGTIIYNYNSSTRKAAVRATNGTYKVVYLGVGIEQLSTTASKNAILKLSHDWFWGLTSTEEFDNAMNAIALGQNYPNPANTSTVIPIMNLDRKAVLEITDFAGRVVFTQEVDASTLYINVNTENFESGAYVYRIIADGQTLSSKSMSVLH